MMLIFKWCWFLNDVDFLDYDDFKWCCFLNDVDFKMMLFFLDNVDNF